MTDIPIQWDGLSEIGPTVRAAAEKRLRALAEQHGDLSSLRISARATEHHRHGAREVHVIAHAKGREIVAARTRPDASLALHDALDAFKRELRRVRGKRAARPRARVTSPRELGLVDRLASDADYGFIRTDRGQEVYFHKNSVSGGLEFARLVEGQRIALTVEEGQEGLQASVVAPAPPDAPAP